MKKILGALACTSMLSACSPAPESAIGFRLPDGDPERGLQVFKAFECNACHTIEGVDLPYIGSGELNYTLGGTTTRVRTYGELVTSIINPSHKLSPGYRSPDGDGRSPMAEARLNEAMTVQQLIDLVAFLQDQYAVVPPEYYPYSRIYP